MNNEIIHRAPVVDFRVMMNILYTRYRYGAMWVSEWEYRNQVRLFSDAKNAATQSRAFIIRENDGYEFRLTEWYLDTMDIYTYFEGVVEIQEVM